MPRHDAIQGRKITMEIPDCAYEHSCGSGCGPASGTLPSALCWSDRVSRHREQQIYFVPDESAIVVDDELVVLAHEDRGHGTCLFAEAAEDAAGLVDLIRDRVAGA